MKDGSPTHGDNPDLGRLLDEAAWLRRLARHLVAQPGAADDVVQETWAAALSGAERHEILAPRAWLGSIARRIAGRQRRGAGRRAERETEHAVRRTSETPGGMDDVAERLELQRIVGEELDGLDEPYRSLLFQQYYEGLAPQEIARRSGVEAGTIRWRAKRGRELLREALVARDGRAWESWAIALAPIAGLPLPASVVTSAAATPALIAMTTKWILAGATAGALAVLGLRTVASEPAHVRPTTRAGAVESGAGTSASTVALESVPNETRRGDALATAAASTAPVRSVIGRGRLETTSKDGIDGATLVFTRADGTEVHAATSPSAWGAIGLTPGDWTLSAGADGHALRTQEVRIPAALVWDHDVALLPTGTIRIRVEDPSGADLSDDYRDPHRLGWALAVLASEEPFAPSVERTFESWFRSPAGRWRGRGGLDDLPHLAPRYLGELHLTSPPPVHVALVVGTQVIEQRRVTAATEELVFRLDPASIGTALGKVIVSISDPANSASLAVPPGVSAKLRSRSRSTRMIFLRRETGRFVATSVPPGDYVLEISPSRSSDRPSLSRDLRVEARAVLDLGEVRLPETEPVHVIVRGDVSLARARLSARATEDAFAPYRQEASGSWAEEDGSFVLRGLPAGSVELVLELRDDRRFAFPVMTVQEGARVEVSFEDAQLTKDEQ